MIHFNISKKGAFSLTAVEFILNIIAVVIVIVSIATIIRINTANAAYTGNQHYKIELDYVLYSKFGLMPDRFTFDADNVETILKNIKSNDLGMRFSINDKEYYFNEDVFNNFYALRTFNGYYYDKIEKPVLLISKSSSAPALLTIEYVFHGEEIPKAVNKNT